MRSNLRYLTRVTTLLGKSISMTFQDQPKQISMTYRQYIFPEINERLHMNWALQVPNGGEVWGGGHPLPSNFFLNFGVSKCAFWCILWPLNALLSADCICTVIHSCKNFTTLCVHFPWLFHDFPGFSMTYVVFHDYPGLEFGLPKSHDFPGPVVTLSYTKISRSTN